VPLYRERYVFVAHRGHRAAGGATITWKEAAAERLCLLSEDMQNRRIINNVAASIGVEINADVVSNSFMAILSHIGHGEWASIVPHTFAHLFGGASDLVAVDIIEPVHTQAIGLVLSDRDPLSPMSGALLSSIENVDFEADLREAGRR
jgi:DNA-binding transcriptional LysR family regulator